MTNRSPLNCRLKSRLNRLFSRNNPVKRYFPLAWTPLPREPGNGSLNGQSEPVLRPEYLMSRASGSTLTRSGFWWCQTFLWIPYLGKYSGVFDRTGGHRHPSGAPIGLIWESGAGKCPDSGCSELGISEGFWGVFRDGKEDGKRLRPCWKKNFKSVFAKKISQIFSKQKKISTEIPES